MLKDWQTKLEQEFNEPWQDVIQGFLDMGYSVKETASIIEVHRLVLVRLGFKSGKG